VRTRGILLAATLMLAGCAASLNELLAAETAERQRSARAASRREESLRRQLEAMKSIERGILEREERMRTEAR